MRQKIEAAIQVYYSVEGGHREEASVIVPVNSGKWQDVSITLPKEAGARPLRIDLMRTLEFVEIAALRVCTPTEEYFIATMKEDFDRVKVTGDAERLPHSKLLRLRITGADPQLVLPALEVKPGDQPLRVELRLNVVDERRGLEQGYLGRFFRKPVRVARPLPDGARESNGSYEDWIRRYDTLRATDLTRISKQIESFQRKPRFSILMPVSAPTPYLQTAIESVRAQLYPFWKLIIVADESLAEEVRHLARCDGRIEVHTRSENTDIADALNAVLISTEAEFVLSLGSEDSLAPTALYLIAHTLNLHPDTRLLYSDEDRLDAGGCRVDPHFKPDWNWELLLAQNFVSQCTVIRADLAKAHGYSTGFDLARDYDLLLRCAESIELEQIHHLPHVLYHRRTIRSNPEKEISAVRQHLERLRIRAEVVASGEGIRRVSYHLPEEQPSVSIVIPTRDRVDLLRPCVQSILEKTTYRAFEIVVVDNGSREPAALAYLAAIAREPRIHVLERDEPFNYSRLTNQGVQDREAEFVLLMNNDVSVIEPGWLEEMVSHGIQPGVGAVGARLLYPDNRVQQAGVILGAGVHGVAEVAHRGMTRSAPGYFSRALLAQEVSAVGAACMLVKRELYLQAGGFDEEHLKVAFNDIDFCLKLRSRGARIIYTPWAELYHHEHASRGTEYTEANEQRFTGEIRFIREKWGDTLMKDPFYNPNLSLERDFFTLAFPPRVSRPWEQTPASFSAAVGSSA